MFATPSEFIRLENEKPRRISNVLSPTVSLQQDDPARRALLLGEDAHGLEELNVLLVRELVDGLHAGVDVEQADLVSLGGPRGVVPVV